MFAVSLSNVPTNLVVTNDNKYPVLGFFCVSAVHGLANTLDDEEIEKIELYNREWLLFSGSYHFFFSFRTIKYFNLKP